MSLASLVPCSPPDVRRVRQAGAAADAALFVIQIRHGRVSYLAERDLAHSDLASTITDIMAGQVEDVERVFEFNAAEAWSRDASEDIAIEIANRLDAAVPVQRSLLAFIEAHAGLAFTTGLRVADMTFSAE